MTEKQVNSHLSFIPFTTFIDPVFWNEINKLKINEWKLDERPRIIRSKFAIRKFSDN